MKVGYDISFYKLVLLYVGYRGEISVMDKCVVKIQKQINKMSVLTDSRSSEVARSVLYSGKFLNNEVNRKYDSESYMVPLSNFLLISCSSPAFWRFIHLFVCSRRIKNS